MNKENSDCYFLPHSAIYLNCHLLLSDSSSFFILAMANALSPSFSIVFSVAILYMPRHIHITRYGEELSKIGISFFSVQLFAPSDTLLRLLFCAICAIQLLCTHHLSNHQVCMMIKPFYNKFVFRTATFLIHIHTNTHRHTFIRIL